MPVKLHSHSHSHSHSPSLTFTLTLTLSHPHSPSLSISLTLTHSPSLTHPHSLTLTDSQVGRALKDKPDYMCRMHYYTHTQTHYLSLSHTHTHKHTTSLSHTHLFTLIGGQSAEGPTGLHVPGALLHTHTHTLSLSLTHTHTHTNTLSLSLSHTHTHKHTISLSHTHLSTLIGGQSAEGRTRLHVPGALLQAWHSGPPCLAGRGEEFFSRRHECCLRARLL